MTTAARTRGIARTAVRAELGQVAFDLFRREGFDNVTVNDLAEAAGVSRSTFLRYFGSKEEAVLSVFEAHGNLVAEALRARPADESDWLALRRALDVAVARYREDPEGALAITVLVQRTPALCAKHLEKQNNWRPALAQALSARDGAADGPTLPHTVLAAAALACLNIALETWTASDGEADLEALIDETFAALAPR